MNKYVVTFIHLKGVDTPCITNKLVNAEDKKHAVNIIRNNFNILKLIDVDRQFV